MGDRPMTRECMVKGVLGVDRVERGKESEVMAVVALGYECEMVFESRSYAT